MSSYSMIKQVLSSWKKAPIWPLLRRKPRVVPENAEYEMYSVSASFDTMFDFSKYSNSYSSD